MMGFMAIFQALSLYTVGIVVPLIPTLYNLFVKLSTFQFLSNSYIHSVWNNIYVLVGVIVMFAIAIKLISTIVNPDTLTDNKKGVKGIYFRTIIAVVMIFIIPMLFTYSFELQKKLIDSNFLISRVFGYKISDDTSVGQLLAWTTLSSFCTLGEAANEEDVRVYNRTKEDLSYLWGLIARIKIEDPWGNPAQVTQGVTKYGSFNYHSILCPLTAFLVAYELLLLCMDTLFRAAKLALLELMLPIVLGAFVFNPEILKKWAKEFISTYLSLFLKVIAIGFMVISFISIKAYIEGDTFFDDWLMQGFFNVLFIIALLQLVKKIPEIINTVFGTHIKTAGGIKGRLGEMAGIGGMAAKAWTSLGTGAKNLAKLGLQAPLVGGYFAADAIYHARTKDHLRNSAAFRGIKGGLYAARAGLKSGSLMDAYKGYEQSQALSALTTRDRRGLSNQLTAAYAPYHVGSQGYDSRPIDNNGQASWRPIHEQNADIQGVTDATKSFIRGRNSTNLQENLDKYAPALKQASILKAAQTTRENLVSNYGSYVQKVQSDTTGRYSPAVISHVEKTGSLVAQDGVIPKKEIEYLAKNGVASEAELKLTTDLIAKNTAIVRQGNQLLNLPEDSSELRKASTLGPHVSGAEEGVKNIEQEAEDYMNDSGVSEVTKIAMKRGQATLKNMTGGYGMALTAGIEGADGNAVEYAGKGEEIEWLEKESTRAAYYTPFVEEYQNSNNNSINNSGNDQSIPGDQGTQQSQPHEHKPADVITPQDFEALDAAEAQLNAEEAKIKNTFGMDPKQREEELRQITREKQKIAARRHELHGGALDE